ncbi:acyltransferase family protein [Anatilimnocola sp. NA78]|uniref:acyltransferase family protein n=1 Tax=Anatilimnocola sp. NA78 TaxID=3415683 RepID=UPI003CE4E074
METAAVDPNPVIHPVPPVPDAPAGRDLALDGLRGLAILLISIYRFNGGATGGETADNSLLHFAALGMRGVDLLFVLSGYLITRMLVDARHDPHFFRNFYARRALRIFPLYYGVLIAVLVVLPLLNPRLGAVFSEARNNQSWLWFYSTNILQAYTGDWPFGFFDHFWSLAVAVHFYLLWPVVIYFASMRSVAAICTILIILSPLVRISWLLAGGNDVAPEVFTLGRADLLAAGGLIAILLQHDRWKTRLLPLAQVGILIFALTLVGIKLSNRRWLTLPDSLFAGLFACLIMLVLHSRRGSLSGAIWQTRWLRFFGKYSYAMYVIQYPLIPLLAPMLSAEVLSTYFASEFLGRTSYIAVMTALTSSIAFVSWHSFEKHFLRLKARFPLGDSHASLPESGRGITVQRVE